MGAIQHSFAECRQRPGAGTSSTGLLYVVPLRESQAMRYHDMRDEAISHVIEQSANRFSIVKELPERARPAAHIDCLELAGLAYPSWRA